MAQNNKAIFPLHLLQEEAPYANLLQQEGAANLPPWDIEAEGELAVDVLETPTELIVRSAIAGVRGEDLSINATTDSLTIRGRRAGCEPHPFAEIHIEECHWGSFSRTIILPSAIRIDEVLATMKHGILTVTLQKLKTSSTVEVLSTD